MDHGLRHLLFLAALIWLLSALPVQAVSLEPCPSLEDTAHRSKHIFVALLSDARYNFRYMEEPNDHNARRVVVQYELVEVIKGDPSQVPYLQKFFYLSPYAVLPRERDFNQEKQDFKATLSDWLQTIENQQYLIFSEHDGPAEIDRGCLRRFNPCDVYRIRKAIGDPEPYSEKCEVTNP